MSSRLLPRSMPWLAYTLGLLALLSPAESPAQTSEAAKDDVMLQGFHWESHEGGNWWNTLAGKADDISAAGFDMVWFPPPAAPPTPHPKAISPMSSTPKTAPMAPKASSKMPSPPCAIGM